MATQNNQRTQGLAGALNAQAKFLPKPIPTPKVMQTASSQRIINNSSFGTNQGRATKPYKAEYSDMPQVIMGSAKKGGIVPKTGAYKLHKGEVVVPKNKVKKIWHMSDGGAMKI